ncbi:MAG: type II toxin-antitoxin system PemK/MazF family toxin [Syntrophomonas sp.]|uniref:type II toxin-antitoxin system PemK/MazF family toxin n=1 Tax=Syntrophomonas sp. TaxID=2053627 RepID=UPI0026215890|nr:type II toxin-antitoxin system PemK/MazF family toxin [Syntrophomonas sp.]MDD2510721.1 type II toxin-antitoxin system PemK/MazF family toxin [Syntrophomonas sp.]MDD3880079.1 type II toxin-antitoxin system PemK/MazF family toxin [Syntrophomonas sp.]MDD4627508.1 type II toxin-antitoxin system PemK/MazF family toxin [Syntrophomonas sp.]
MIKRGEIYMVDFNPARGSEQAGYRPALIIQNDIGNRYSPTTIIATITTANKKFPFTVPIQSSDSVLEKDSVVNLSQILTIDKERLMRKIGELDDSYMRKIDQAIKISLGLDV